MKKLSLSEQGKVLGGYDADECRRVQAVAATYAKMQQAGFKVSDDAWDEWCEEYDKYC